LHLQREPAAGIDRIALPERIRDLLDIDSVQCNSHSDSATLSRIVNENELALLSFWDVAKEGVSVFLVEFGLRMRSRCSDGSAMRSVWCRMAVD
jgi:hypothetical protein